MIDREDEFVNRQRVERLIDEFKKSLEKKELQVTCKACCKRHNASAVHCPHCGLRRDNPLKPC